MLRDNMDKKVGLKRGLRAIERNNKILLANRDNGGSMFISKECYDIILQAIKENMTFRELVDCIEDDESQKYMLELLEQMANNRFWMYDDRRINCTDYQISLDITNSCNLRCKHCCVTAGDFKSGEELDENRMMIMLEKIVKLQPASICISGGEPLMRKDFCSIVLFIRDHYKGVLSLMTNATLINEEKAGFIAKYFDYVDVSIDGCDEDSCKILRGEGTFDKCIYGIKLLQKKGVDKISASMVLTKDNEYAKDGFMKLCKKMNLFPMIRGLDQCGRAENSVKPPIEKYQKRNMDEIKNKFIENNLWEIPPQIMTCQGAKIEFQISYTGDIYPCGALMDNEFFLGNIFIIDDLKDYLENNHFHEIEGYKNFISYMPTHIERCKDCDFNLLCFTCVSEIRNMKKTGELYKDCKEQYFVHSLYWEKYEGN